MRWQDLSEENCPVARGLSVVGDRWTLLILRDCFRGVRRFEDFRTSLKITRHVLADRLRGLEADGVLERRLYCEAPPRHEYRLTERGLDLYPVIVTLIQWAETHRPKPGLDPHRFLDRETGRDLEPVLVDRETGTPIEARRVVGKRPG